MGISVISEIAVEEFVADGKLLSFPLEDTMPHHLYFAYKKKYLSPRQVEFRDFILSCIFFFYQIAELPAQRTGKPCAFLLF